MALEEIKNEPFIDAKPAALPERLPLGTILGKMADAMDDTKKTVDRYKKITV